jgi:5-methylcytosine-specific restriction protein A
MAWATSKRRDELPSDWTTRRVRVLRRDSYKCQARDSLGVLCGAPANQVDHIEPGNDHSYENLRSLCRWHHARKSYAEGAAARRPHPRQRREPERHSGMIAAS